jgi:hypothetical protein
MIEQRAHTTNPKLEHCKELPLHTYKLLRTNATLSGRMHANYLEKQRSCFILALTGQTSQRLRFDRWARSPNTWELTPVRPVGGIGQADDHLGTAQAQN